MTRLALLAVLLMALAPSVGRMLAGAGTRVLEGWTELCTTDGLKWVDTGKQSPLGKPSPGTGHASMGEDCAYCRLVDLLPLLVLFVLAALPRAPASRFALPAAPRLRVPQNLRGLGSRGPPLPL